jgi:hypothetical protein
VHGFVRIIHILKVLLRSADTDDGDQSLPSSWRFLLRITANFEEVM